ncbi:MAG: leucyl/phenylalanyl-tRNA--protein transferase [Weeksellaceae bacterium]|nr:leucyl/phenylalanyl-tRNA--protein transferase [Weeksellaceae bacterium]
MIKRLTDELIFPDYSEANPDGILAYGGDLSVERLKLAYRKGIFPWYNPGEPILWWFPDPRFVLYPEELKVSKSMTKILRENIFEITENHAFEEVISNCQKIFRPGQCGTWITNEMKAAYLELHRIGIAKSVEVWQNDELVGGFYGIEQKRVFCGESMFAKVSNASKAGFICFVRKYQKRYELIDCQVYTPHLESLGAGEITAEEFLRYLSE